MTGTCAACLHTNQSRSYLNHLVYCGNRLQIENIFPGSAGNSSEETHNAWSLMKRI
jgi:hypothetical protein